MRTLGAAGAASASAAGAVSAAAGRGFVGGRDIQPMPSASRLAAGAGAGSAAARGATTASSSAPPPPPSLSPPLLEPAAAASAWRCFDFLCFSFLCFFSFLCDFLSPSSRRSIAGATHCASPDAAFAFASARRAFRSSASRASFAAFAALTASFFASRLSLETKRMPPSDDGYCAGAAASDIAKIARDRLRAMSGLPRVPACRDERCGVPQARCEWRALAFCSTTQRRARSRREVQQAAKMKAAMEAGASESGGGGGGDSSQAPRRRRSRRSRVAMGDLDLPDFIDEELLDADEDFDDERAGKRRKLEPEEEQRQLRERLHLEQRALQERQMQEQVRHQFLHYARYNGIAQQDQVEILDELSTKPYEEQREYINSLKARVTRRSRCACDRRRIRTRSAPSAWSSSSAMKRRWSTRRPPRRAWWSCSAAATRRTRTCSRRRMWRRTMRRKSSPSLRRTR